MMIVHITIDNYEKQCLEDSGFSDAFSHTVKEYVNTISSIVKSACSIFEERNKKNEGNY